MGTAPKPPAPTYTISLGVLSAFAAPIAAARLLASTGVIHISNGDLNSGLTIAAVTLLSATFSLGWRRTVLRSRAERAKLNQRIDTLETRVENTTRPDAASVRYPPPRTHQPYRAIVNGGSTPTPGAVDPDTADALRRINLRLRRMSDN